MSDTEKRLARLERENRWIKRLGAMAIGVAGLFALVAAEQKSEAPDNITAKTFTLVGPDGKTLAVLNGHVDAGKGPAFLIFDDEGEADVALTRTGVTARRYSVPGVGAASRSVVIVQSGIKAPMFDVVALGGDTVGSFGLFGQELGGGAVLAIFEQDGTIMNYVSRQGFVGRNVPRNMDLKKAGKRTGG